MRNENTVFFCAEYKPESGKFGALMILSMTPKVEKQRNYKTGDIITANGKKYTLGAREDHGLGIAYPLTIVKETS